MPRYTIIVYQCPRCHTDLARQIRLITSHVTSCPGCGRSVRVSMSAVWQNWGYCFGVIGGVLTWLALGGLSLADKDFALMIGHGMFKDITLQQQLLIASVGCLAWAFVVGFFLAPIGAILGNIVVLQAPDGTPDLPSRVPGTRGTRAHGSTPLRFYPPPRGKTAVEPSGTRAEEPEPVPRVPVRRSLWVRTFFIFFWPVFFFVAALIATSVLDGSLAEKNEALRAQINAQSSEKFALPTVGVTLVLFVLGGFGLLPWTRRTKMVPDSTASGSAAVSLGIIEAATPDKRRLSNNDATVRISVAEDSPDEGRPRNVLVRLFFILLWPPLFFLATATVQALIVGARAENEEMWQQLSAQSIQENTGWMLLTTLALFVLGCLGLLPWTGRKTRRMKRTGQPTSLVNLDEQHQTSRTEVMMDRIESIRK